MASVHAVFENGIFRPIHPVELPDHCEVEFEPRVIESGATDTNSIERLYDILSERFASGQTDVAARHNEHQP